jgi:hypothetical protein
VKAAATHERPWWPREPVATVASTSAVDRLARSYDVVVARLASKRRYRAGGDRVAVFGCELGSRAGWRFGSDCSGAAVSWWRARLPFRAGKGGSLGVVVVGGPLGAVGVQQSAGFACMRVNAVARARAHGQSRSSLRRCVGVVDELGGEVQQPFTQALGLGDSNPCAGNVQRASWASWENDRGLVSCGKTSRHH